MRPSEASGPALTSRGSQFCDAQQGIDTEKAMWYTMNVQMNVHLNVLAPADGYVYFFCFPPVGVQCLKNGNHPP